MEVELWTIELYRLSAVLIYQVNGVRKTRMWAGKHQMLRKTKTLGQADLCRSSSACKSCNLSSGVQWISVRQQIVETINALGPWRS